MKRMVMVALVAFLSGSAMTGAIVGRYQLAAGPAGTLYKVRFDRWTGRSEWVRPQFAQE